MYQQMFGRWGERALTYTIEHINLDLCVLMAFGMLVNVMSSLMSVRTPSVFVFPVGAYSGVFLGF